MSRYKIKKDNAKNNKRISRAIRRCVHTVFLVIFPRFKSRQKVFDELTNNARPISEEDIEHSKAKYKLQVRSGEEMVDQPCETCIEVEGNWSSGFFDVRKCTCKKDDNYILTFPYSLSPTSLL